MNFDLFDFEPKIEDSTTKILTPKMLKMREKETSKNFLKKEKANLVLTEIPEIGESFHIVSNGSFDYFTLIPIIVKLLGGKSNSFYFSTWTMNMRNSEEIIKMFDNGCFEEIKCLVGLYMKKREPSVFNFMYENLKERSQVIFANENHSKVTLLNFGENYIVVQGSANFTANPRIEQFSIHNSKELFNFHKNWMDEVIR